MESTKLSFRPVCSPEPLGYLEGKLQTLREFLAITESLKAKLDLQDMSVVIQLLNQRQNLIQNIDRMDNQIQEIRSKCLLKGGEYPDEIKGEVLNISKTVEDVLRRVETVDQQCINRINSWRNEIRSELLKMRHGLRAVQFYAGGTVHPPRFLDVRR